MCPICPKLRLCALLRPALCLLRPALCLLCRACCTLPCARCAVACCMLRRLKALSPRLSSSERSAAVDEALEQMRRMLTGMAGALGADHLLVTAGTRYMAQLSVMLGPRQ